MQNQQLKLESETRRFSNSSKSETVFLSQEILGELASEPLNTHGVSRLLDLQKIESSLEVVSNQSLATNVEDLLKLKSLKRGLESLKTNDFPLENVLVEVQEFLSRLRPLFATETSVSSSDQTIDMIDSLKEQLQEEKELSAQNILAAKAEIKALKSPINHLQFDINDLHIHEKIKNQITSSSVQHYMHRKRFIQKQSKIT